LLDNQFQKYNMLSTLAHSSPLSLQPTRSLRPTLLQALSELSLAGSDTDAARLFLDRASSATMNRHDRTALVKVAHGLASIMASARSVCAKALETSFSNAADHGATAGSSGFPSSAIAAPAVDRGKIDNQAHGPSARRGSSRLPAHATAILQDWFHHNQASPYATSEVLARLVEITGLSHSQVSGWLTNVRKRVWKRDQSAFVSAKHSIARPPVANASRRKFARKTSVRRADARQFYDDDDTESEAGDDEEEETAEYFSSAAIHAAAAMAEVLAGGNRTLSSSAADSLMMPPLCSFSLAEQHEDEAAQRAVAANADLQMWSSELALSSGADASSGSSAWIASPSTSAASAAPFSFNAIDEPMM
jgi:hypothetical protein